jgi:hypothetical protein
MLPDWLWGTRDPLPRGKQSGHETDHSPWFNAEIVSRAVLPPLYSFMACTEKHGWSHSMNYPSNCNEHHQLLQKLLRACTCGWPDTPLSHHHKHITIISNSSSGVWITPDLFWNIGCWSVHLYIGQLMFLLPVGMYLYTFLRRHIGYS